MIGILLVLLAILWRISKPVAPDPRMVGLAARATLYALPTPTPQRIVVTQVVVVTQIVVVTATPAPLDAFEAAPLTADIAAPTPLPEAPPTAARALPTNTVEPATPTAEAVQPAAVRVVAVSVDATVNQEDAPSPANGVCPISSSNQYVAIPVAGGGLDHPPAQHADLNLSLRGYEAIDAARTLINKDGPVDGDPPQLDGLFSDNRAPQFGQPYRVYDWDWGCAAHGCRGGLLDAPQATLVVLHMYAGETVRIPRRSRQIYGGGFKAMVLYAEPTRITLGYTREDSVANGYAVHIENLCVDPNLLALYINSDANGRSSLPALREEEVLGVATLGDLLVAVRDRGAFLDPRSRLDWWQEN
ncbi:MAG: hypothetical protein KJZ95_02585 [Caldilinea sp.]|nr:hypothetical protein [Caldilinea sp.]